jgi:hypothetical protein
LLPGNVGDFLAFDVMGKRNAKSLISKETEKAFDCFDCNVATFAGDIQACGSSHFLEKEEEKKKEKTQNTC